MICHVPTNNNAHRFLHKLSLSRNRNKKKTTTRGQELIKHANDQQRQ